MSVTGHEDEFRALFEQEAVMRLGALAEQALELESAHATGHGSQLIVQMFRDAHTLKGGAAVVGFDDVAATMHALETLLEALREGRLRPDAAVVDAVLAAIDAVRGMVSVAMAGGDVADTGRATAAALLAAAEGRAPEPALPAPFEAAAESPPASQSQSADTVAGAHGDDRADAILVPVERLDRLVRLVGESAAAQLRVGRLLGPAGEGSDEYRDLARVLGELQEQAMHTRMVTVATIAEPLRRAVRDLARGAGKQVRWELAGEATELDRHVLEQLRDPLLHIVRNAVDHGLEPPEERRRAGKPAEGHVRIHAMQLGSEVVIAVTDDGRGIDLERVRERAGRPELSDADALALVFRSGVSTAAEVTDVSGRGVGLDAVRATLDSLRGRVDVRSQPGHGTEFRLSVPMTLAVLPCLLVDAGDRRLALPMHAAVAVAEPPEPAQHAEGRPVVWIAGEALPATDLAHVLGITAAPAQGPAIVLSATVGRHAFRVDRLAGQRDVVVKDLGGLVPRLPLLMGASVEPDGTIMLVLDPTGLIERTEGRDLRRATSLTLAAAAAPDADDRPALPAAGGRATVLVVDDALTVRELQRSILARAGYDVLVAADGQDALARLAEHDVDLVLTDVEMPRMDGFELTQEIRARPRTAGVPVVILTSLTDDEHRRRGLEAGADSYLVKASFDEHALLGAVERLLGAGS